MQTHASLHGISRKVAYLSIILYPANSTARLRLLFASRRTLGCLI
jgi:hypothetical protein